MKLKVKNFTWYVPLLVSEELGQNLILGADFISKTGLILDMYAKQYFFRFDRTRKYQFDSEFSNDTVSDTANIHSEPNESSLSHLKGNERLRIQKLIKDFSAVLTPKLGLTHLIEYKINLSDNKVIRLHLSLIHI